MRNYSCLADSGNLMHRRFCALCGTPLFSESVARPTLIYVRSGTLDEANLVKPEATIWTSMAPRWACINETLPQFDRQAPPPQS